MKDISIKDFQIGNDQDLTLMGGMNVLESEETALLVCLLYTSDAADDS